MTEPQPQDQPGQSSEQAALERAAGQVSDVLLNLEHALTRARKARKVVEKDGIDTNAELALADLIRDLERARKRLQQDTYFAGDALRLL